MSTAIPCDPAQLFSWLSQMCRTHPVWFGEEQHLWHLFGYQEILRG